MKKFIAYLCVAVMTVSAVPAFAAESEPVCEEKMIGMPSPIVDYDSLEEAEKAAGISINAPESIEGYPEISYSVINGTLLQVIYRTEDGEKQISIRKEAGTEAEDISGDYNIYTESGEAEIYGIKIALKGNNGKTGCAVFFDGEYSYAVGAYDFTKNCAEGIETEKIKDIVDIVLSLPILTDDTAEDKEIEEDKEEITGMPNPFITYDSLEKAEKAVGFDITLPDEIKGYKIDEISVMSGTMLQIIYTDGTNKLVIRKTNGNGDISGDYNEYTNTYVKRVDGKNVTFKGTGSISNAVWEKNGNAYSVYTNGRLAFDTVSDIVSAIK